jgi:phosphopantothenoylcysteine decarboxylase/phosphopantothenate--cysteine ligase
MSKNILLGITGSVAASKSEILFNKLLVNNNVRVISTDAGLRYLTEEFIKKQAVISSWEYSPGALHIDLARWADTFIIYPATANFISKMAMGVADDLLLSTILMYNKAIYLAPAMHEEMYENKIIQDNIKKLSNDNVICGPRFGNLDIGDEGLGRMIEPEEMLHHIHGNKQKVIVTSGGTSEMIDSVRTISNTSSGKQGRALGMELLARGFDVTYLHAYDIRSIPHAKNISFTDSDSLIKILKEELYNSTYLYMAAAVSDFIPNFTNKKMDRSKGPISLNLNPNQDIIKNIVQNFPKLVTVAFSAQEENDLNFKKIKDKNVNFLVIKNILKNKIGSDFNQVSIINHRELVYSSTKLNKNKIASLIIDYTIN